MLWLAVLNSMVLAQLVSLVRADQCVAERQAMVSACERLVMGLACVPDPIDRQGVARRYSLVWARDYVYWRHLRPHR